MTVQARLLVAALTVLCSELWGHHVLRPKGLQAGMSQGLARTLFSALLLNITAICHHPEPLRAPGLQEETNTLEAKTPRQGKENRLSTSPARASLARNSAGEELQLAPAELSGFTPQP